MLLGRTTWQLFSRIWPSRDDPFPARMNAAPKLVATRSLTDTSAWANSRVIDGDLVDAVRRERRDVIITGSLGVVRALMAADLIDEYRLLTFPAIPGAGERLFPAGGPPRGRNRDVGTRSHHAAGDAPLMSSHLSPVRRTSRSDLPRC